ncbi:ubiquitin-conjugating enzyme family protein [Priestia aryabhattai]
MNLYGAEEFLKDYPDMSFSPMKGSELFLRGTLKFKARFQGTQPIEDKYELEIAVPENFPYELPKVRELEQKIPRDLNHHINPDDTLCLGSPLRMIMKLYKSPTLNTYAEECLIPYLYAVSYKLQNGGDFVFGELEHGGKGLISDYLDILNLDKSEQVIKSLSLLSMKKRVANKKICPCGCYKKLGSCIFHLKMNELRKVAPRSFFKIHLQDIKQEL